MTQLLLQIIILTLFAMGCARIIRSLPGITRLENWLYQTWTQGKPIACWTCLIFWSSLLGTWLFSWSTIQDRSLAIICATGLGGTILKYLEPLAPNLPIIEDLDEEH